MIWYFNLDVDWNTAPVRMGDKKFYSCADGVLIVYDDNTIRYINNSFYE